MLSRPRRVPKKYTPRQRLQTIASGAPEDTTELLNAVVGGFSEKELIEEGKRTQPSHIVEDAAQLYGEAWAYFSRSERAATQVRGCSRQLLMLAARQAVRLQDLVQRRDKENATLHKERNEARTEFHAAFEFAVKLRDQVRFVLSHAAGTDPKLQAAIDEAARAKDREGAPTAALTRLAELGHAIVANAPNAALLPSMYGLDISYLDEIDTAIERLARAELKLDSLLESEGLPERRIQHLAGINIKLMLQILDAFLGAHELFIEVPVLNPKQHEYLMRRISRLPPPPAPVVLKSLKAKKEQTLKFDNLKVPRGAVIRKR